MKSFLAMLVLVCALTSARAGILIGSLSTVSTANTNTPNFQTNSVIVAVPQFTVSNGALSITNAYSGFFRYSFDNTNFYTNASPAFIPTATSAASYTIGAQSFTVPVYVQLVAITNSASTGTITLGVSSP